MAPLEDWARDALSPRYEVIREVARGGMAVVYLAHDRRLEREVAIKVLPPAQATANSAEAFLREARILAGLSHPALVPVHDADSTKGLFYYVMDFVPSPTLSCSRRVPPIDDWRCGCAGTCSRPSRLCIGPASCTAM
jgi:serine/threonine protein kinase